jgi:hypothetical protein
MKYKKTKEEIKNIIKLVDNQTLTIEEATEKIFSKFLGYGLYWLTSKNILLNNFTEELLKLKGWMNNHTNTSCSSKEKPPDKPTQSKSRKLPF